MKKKFDEDSDYTESSDTEENKNKKQKSTENKPIYQTRRRANSDGNIYDLQIKSRSKSRSIKFAVTPSRLRPNILLLAY